MPYTCAHCKKEFGFSAKQSGSHGICRGCIRNLLPEHADKIIDKMARERADKLLKERNSEVDQKVWYKIMARTKTEEVQDNALREIREKEITMKRG